MAYFYIFLFLAIGSIATILFHGNIYIPIWMSILIFMGISIYLLFQFRRERLGALMLLLWLVYALPFIHIVPYLWFDFDSEAPLLLWGLAVNPYMLDEQIIKLTAMIGAVGGVGFALGVSLNNRKIVRHINLNFKQARSLSIPIWIAWVVAGVMLSWIAAPQETLFTAVYTASTSLLSNANFDSAWLISYVLLTFALCDAIMDRTPARAALKRWTIFGAIAFVVVFLQLLRGDRESLPFVFGALMVYFYWAATITRRRYIKLPWLKIVLGVFIMVVVSMIIGAIRQSIVGITDFRGLVALIAYMADSEVIGISNLLHGTWSAVLLTPLSVAGDHINGLLPLKFGQTYLDLFLSIPPGFIADLFGYVRPIDALAGPAWEMRYGGGGIHASVVPFMNFSMIGVFLIPALWAYLLTCIEKRAMRRMSAINLSLLCTVALASPHWLWYGEKAGFNAFVIWLMLTFAYRVSLSLLHYPKLQSLQRTAQAIAPVRYEG